jgi:hypothetical protein
MDFEKIMDGLTGELEKALKAMAKAKTVEDKLQYSQVVNNLCTSMGVFLDFASDLSSLDLEAQ